MSIPFLDSQISSCFFSPLSFCNTFWARIRAIIVKVFPKPISSAGEKSKEQNRIQGVTSTKGNLEPDQTHLKLLAGSDPAMP